MMPRGAAPMRPALLRSAHANGGLRMAPPSPSSLIERRREQMFPVFDSTQVEIARRFGGEPRRFKPDEIVFEFGQVGAPAYLVLSGSIKVARRDGLGRVSAITDGM